MGKIIQGAGTKVYGIYVAAPSYKEAAVAMHKYGHFPHDFVYVPSAESLKFLKGMKLVDLKGDPSIRAMAEKNGFTVMTTPPESIRRRGKVGLK